MTAGIIANGLHQAKADCPDKADAQCVVEHGLVVLTKGNARINCSGL